MKTVSSQTPRQKAMGRRSAEQVIAAIESNLLDASVSMGRTEDGVVFRGTDVNWVYTGYRGLNRVMGARFTDEPDERVCEIAECFRLWDASVQWIVGPGCWPPRLAEILGEQGFGMKSAWLGMACDLTALPARSAFDRPRVSAGNGSAVEIAAVETAEALQQWVDVADHAWGQDSSEGAGQIFSLENAGSDPRSKYYIALHDDQPVARTMSHTRGDVTGIHHTAAHKDHRSHGYEILAVYKALQDARDAGAKLAVMIEPHSHFASTGVSEAFGFKPYCQFKIMSWPPEPIKMC